MGSDSNPASDAAGVDNGRQFIPRNLGTVLRSELVPPSFILVLNPSVQQIICAVFE